MSNYKYQGKPLTVTIAVELIIVEFGDQSRFVYIIKVIRFCECFGIISFMKTQNRNISSSPCGDP